MNTSYDMQAIIKDAHDNYLNGRMEDAFAHYDSITTRFLQQGKIEEALYFSYRALLCKNQEFEQFSYLRYHTKIALYMLQTGLKQLHELSDAEIDPWNQNQILMLQYELVNEMTFEGAKPAIEEKMMRNYTIILEEHDLPLTEKMSILERMVNLERKFSISIDISPYKSELANLMVQKAKNLETNEIKVYQKLQLLNSASTLFQEIGETRPELQEMIETLDEFVKNM